MESEYFRPIVAAGAFAMALSEQILLKGQPIEITFRTVRKKVLSVTAGRQTPWDSLSLIEPFIFAP